MRKLMLCLSIISLFFITTAECKEDLSAGGYDLSGKIKVYAKITVDANIHTQTTTTGKPQINVDEYITANAMEHEHFVFFNIAPKSTQEQEETRINIHIKNRSTATGTVEPFGMDYRLIYFDENYIPTDVSEQIRSDSSYVHISLILKKFGTYVLYYNPCIYDVTFYSEDVSEDESILNKEKYVIKKITNVSPDTVIEFPEIPEKKGYIFTGWKEYGYKSYLSRAGGTGAIPCRFTNPQPLKATHSGVYFATWCPKKEYDPINIEISSNKITKGKEDGKKITLTTNYGIFADEEELNANPECWNIIGNDDLSIDNVARINDKTVKITLTGKSSVLKKDSDIYIEFDSFLLYPEKNESNYSKIKMDEDGVRAKMYRSDNAVTLKSPNSSSSGGGGSQSNKMPAVIYAPTQTITETNNHIILAIGKKEATVFGEVKTNDVAPVIKDDRTFLPARFVAETLGADVEWNSENKTVTITKGTTKIVITTDSGTATVNGETVTLDCPAFIENDRTYTPVRFIAEALGAKVEWNEITRTVTITK